MSQSRIELLLGWLAVIIAGAVAAQLYFGGFIAPDSVQPDLIGIALILLTMAIGVTLDGIFDLLPGRVLLLLATIAYFGVAAISFIEFLLPSAGLAIGATLLAFLRPHGDARRA